MDNRRTGRTTRMLQHAIETASTGNYVVVIAQDHEHAKQLQSQAGVMANVETYATKIAVGNGTITFESSQGGQFEWQTLRLRGAFPTIPTYVDHHAIEETLGKVLHELHRWDKDE